MNATPQRCAARSKAGNVTAFTNAKSAYASQRAFTLVELLTVIAIIAILTAIILPVFATVKENARRTACMSNMQQMYTALKQYELDNRRYPDFLLGPAIKANGSTCATVQIPATNGTTYGIPAKSGDTACSMQQAAGQQLLGGQFADPLNNANLWAYAGGLYPEYIKTLETFHCPNNTPDLGGADTQSDVSTATANRAAVGPDPTTGASSGTVNTDTPTEVSATYYKYDSYDANPDISGGIISKSSPVVWQTRYSRLWTRVRSGQTSDPLPVSTATDYTSYRNQMYWRAPSGDTYITMCSYHAPKGKVTVLWLSGTAKAVDVNKLKSYSNAGHTPNLTGDNGNDYDVYKLKPGD